MAAPDDDDSGLMTGWGDDPFAFAAGAGVPTPPARPGSWCELEAAAAAAARFDALRVRRSGTLRDELPTPSAIDGGGEVMPPPPPLRSILPALAGPGDAAPKP